MAIYVCDKCGGKGRIAPYGHIERGICFKCNGRGTLSYNPDTTRFYGAEDEQPEHDYDAYIQRREREFWANLEATEDLDDRQRFWEENGFEAS